MRAFLSTIFFSFIAISRTSYADATEKDPTTAVMISMGASLGGGLVLSALGAKTHSVPIDVAAGLAFVVGPSTGRWYAGDDGAVSLGLRTAGTVMLVSSVRYFIDSAGNDCLGETDAECAAQTSRQHRDDAIAGGAFLAGVGLVVTTTVYDYIQSDHAARRWNTEHLQLAPLTAQHAMGLSLVGRF